MTQEIAKQETHKCGWDFPSGPVLRILQGLPLKGAWVWSLVRELRAHIPQDEEKKKKKIPQGLRCGSQIRWRLPTGALQDNQSRGGKCWVFSSKQPILSPTGCPQIQFDSIQFTFNTWLASDFAGWRAQSNKTALTLEVSCKYQSPRLPHLWLDYRGKGFS